MLGEKVKPKTVRALVTGAGSGIGACYARHLAELGYDLTIVARDRRRLETTADAIRRTTGVDVEVLSHDLATTAAVDELVRRVASDPAIEIVVNSAGSCGWGAATELDRQQLEAEVALNVAATHRITLAAARAMQLRRRGAVVNVASLAAFSAQPYTSTYCGTKAFLATFSEALHEELRPSGVVVQALCPGFTRTGIFATAGVDESKIPGFLWLEPEYVVRASLAALRRRRALCIPGLRYRIGELVMRFMPKIVRRRLMGFFLSRFDRLRLKPAGTPENTTASGAVPEPGQAARTSYDHPLETVP